MSVKRPVFKIFSPFCTFYVFMGICCSFQPTSTATENCQNNCTYTQAVSVQLLPLNGDPANGTVQIAVPNHPQHHSVCYLSPNLESYQRLAYLCHVFCRQLGYMTYSSWYDKELRELSESWNLQEHGFECLGHEQALYQCAWKDLSLSACHRVIAVLCHDCTGTIEDAEGMINSPGFPYAYFFTVLCEWTIIAPESHELTLVFRYFNLPVGKHFSFKCAKDSARLEVVYGKDASLTTQRFCALEDIRSMTLQGQRKAVIRFYSGVLLPTSDPLEHKYGFSLIFQAEKIEKSASHTTKVLIIGSGFLLFFICVGSCYLCRKCDSLDFFKRRQRQEDHYICERPLQPTELRGARKFILRYETSSSPSNKENIKPVKWSKQIETHDPEASPQDAATGIQNFSPSITPCAIPEITDSGTYNMDRSKLASRSKLRTILLSKFTPSKELSSGKRAVPSSGKKSPVPGTPQSLGFQIYRSLSSASQLGNSDDERNELVYASGSKANPSYDDSSSPTKSSLSSSSNIPTIVVECVNNSKPRKLS